MDAYKCEQVEELLLSLSRLVMVQIKATKRDGSKTQLLIFGILPQVLRSRHIRANAAEKASERADGDKASRRVGALQ